MAVFLQITSMFRNLCQSMHSQQHCLPVVQELQQQCFSKRSRWNNTVYICLVPIRRNASTANGLNAGNYTVTITDANGCTKSASASVQQPAALSLNIQPTNTSCNGVSDGSAITNQMEEHQLFLQLVPFRWFRSYCKQSLNRKLFCNSN